MKLGNMKVKLSEVIASSPKGDVAIAWTIAAAGDDDPRTEIEIIDVVSAMGHNDVALAAFIRAAVNVDVK